MKFLRIIILLAAFFAVGAFSAQANSSSPWPSQAKRATSTPRPTRTKVQTPTRTPSKTRTFTLSPTNTATFTRTPTLTYTPSSTRTSTFTFTSTDTPTLTETPTLTSTPNESAFVFASMGDAQDLVVKFLATSNQIASLNPAFVIFNGDLESNGVVSTEMNEMVADLKTSGIFDQTFLVRGNHDNHVSGSAALWESYFETAPNIKVLPAGVTDYVSLNSSSDTLTYSFIYGNSMFLGFDVPGGASLLTSAQLTFMDTRLIYAESRGLVHAFIYFHGPIYCVESTHCTCTARTDASCTPSALITVINKHPIISAFFHGHEHILGWVHMDNTRLSALTGSFEEFITSPSGGGTYNAYLYPARMDYYYPDMGTYEKQGFATISVNGRSFTFSIYKVGTTSPVWSKTFTK